MLIFLWPLRTYAVGRGCLLLQQQGIDSDSIVPISLFRFTPEGYRRFFPDSDYIEASGHLLPSLALGHELLFKLSIKVQDREANNSLGRIERGPALLIQFIDGKTLILNTDRNARVWEKEAVFYYELIISLDKKTQKILKNKELDRVSILWSGGKKTYEVYYLDFFADLL